jgi:AbrB family looped-hinge helix DNA binding protein
MFSSPGESQLEIPDPPGVGRCRFALFAMWNVFGNFNGMGLRIDKAGRIVVPKPLRERLGFKPDTELEVIEQPEGVLLKRVEQRPSMVKVDGLWVHQGGTKPGANWDRLLEGVREERIESVLKA